MSFDKFTEEIDINVDYNRDDNEKIISSVVSTFDSLNNARQSQIDMIDDVESLFDIKDKVKASNKESFNTEEYSYLKDSAVIRILGTAQHQVYNTIFKNIDNMFDVELVDFEDKEDSDKSDQVLLQKYSILNALKQSDSKSEFRKGLRNFYKKGEFILKLSWTQDFRITRKKDKFSYIIDGEEVTIDKLVYEKELVYDGVKIYNIEPENFVYDTSYPDFNSAPKISRKYVPFESIQNNDVYKEFMKKEDYESLKEMSQESCVSSDNSDLESDFSYDKTSGIINKQIEILEYEGNITIDGKYYPNMKIVTIARSFVGCFMYNPSLFSSYLYSAFEIDEKTGRGIGLVARLLSLSKATTEALRKLNRALGLSINKCFLAPSGSFSGLMEIYENAIIEYNKNKADGNQLIPLDFLSALNTCMNYLQYLKGEMEEASSRYKYSSGDSPKGQRTLGEIKIVTEGQNTTVAYEIDQIYDEVVLPLVEKIGQIMANMKEGEERIKFVNSKGENSIGIIDDTVRTANYNYYVTEPTNSAAKKLDKIDFLDSVLTKVAPYMNATGQGKLSAPELLKILTNGFDISNHNKLILQEEQPQQVNTQQLPLDLSQIQQ